MIEKNPLLFLIKKLGRAKIPRNFAEKTKEVIEMTPFERKLTSLQGISEIIDTIRNSEITSKQEEKIKERLGKIKRENKNFKLLEIFVDTTEALLSQKNKPSPVLRSFGFDKSVLPTEYLLKIDTARLSPTHRKFLNEDGAENHISLANDVIGKYGKNGKINSVLLLEVQGDNFLNFEYKVKKEIPYVQILQEADFVLKKGKSREKMLEVFKLIHQNPDLYHKFRKEIVSPQSPVEMSFKGIFHLFSLMLQLNRKNFEDVKRFYQRLPTKQQQDDFLESISALNNNSQILESYIQALNNKLFLENGNNRFLTKFRGILELIEKRNDLIREVMTERGQESIDPWEYNEAILRRLEQLLVRASQVESKKEADKLLNESEVFNEKLIVEGAFFRGNFDVIKNMKPEEISDLFKNFSAEKVRVGDLIKDPFDMENPANYLQPDKFSVEDYRMIVRNLKEAYGNRYPKYLEVLTLNFAKDLQDKSVEFLFVRYKSKLKGVAKVKKLDDDMYYYGTMYVEKEFQKDFKVGSFVQGLLLGRLFGKNILASSSFNNSVVERHKKSGWEIIGKKTETAIRKSGEMVESEELLSLQLSN